MIYREQLQFDFDASALSDAGLDAVFDEALRAMVKKKPHPPVEARFYPYAGLSSTIRLREGRVYARISDILQHAPRPVLYALACILVGKLYRVKVTAEHERVYRDYTHDPTIRDASESARRTRGYKLTT